MSTLYAFSTSFRRMMSRTICFVWLSVVAASCTAADPLQLLFLGDRGHHQPKARADQLIPVMKDVGIEITYTDDADSMSPDTLAKYDGLIVYANIDNITASQEAALLEYVADGGGFIPLHCATYCFRNAPAIVDLMGAQFLRHGGEVFSTEVSMPDHPLVKGYGGFESWDETYIHTKHNERNRIVLEVRKQGGQAEGNEAEPWTWIRTHGKGRVFYTAWGHDHRTWGHPGFQNLIERGIRWACGQDPALAGDYSDPNVFRTPAMTAPRTDVAEFEYEDVGPKIPNYVPSNQWGTRGENFSMMQKPLPPEESIKHYVTPQNFHLELVASEPDFQGKPIAMNWDHRGRMWVCETVDYPNQLMPPGEGRDRIRICEDTDQDGVADKFTVFAENLSIPTSLEFYKGGVIVQAGVETLYLRDNDGDDVADQRDILITGWQMGDTHGGVSNFQYGLDNTYWAMQGYNNSRPRFAGGSHRGFRQGPFRFSMAGSAASPEVTDVEFIRSTTNNSWGLGSTEEGLIFCSTANRAPSFFVPIPNRYYERVRGWTPRLVADEIAPDHLFDPITSKVRQMDHHGGYTAGAGHAIYTARNYPMDWWNKTAFVCGPTGHLIGTFVLKRDGSSFRDRNTFNLVASDDEWAAPIMAEVGPDGNVWIIDWYNYIVQHNPTPVGFETGKGNAYETDLRDKTHGRVYRLIYDGGTNVPNASSQPKLDPENPETLISALTHPNRLWRRHAQRLLVERGRQDVVDSLIGLIGDNSVDATNNNPGAIHALWTLHGLGALASSDSDAFAAAVKALNHPAAGVRRNAALVLPDAPASVEAILASGNLSDDDAQARLAALLALADNSEHEKAGATLARLSQDASILSDEYFSDALICAAASHSSYFLQGLLSMSSPQTQQTGASSEAQGTLLQVVAEHWARTDNSQESLESMLAALANAPAGARTAVISGLAAGWPEDAQLTLSAEGEKAIDALLAGADTEELAALLRLGKSFGSDKVAKYMDQLVGDLLDQVDDEDGSTRDRVDAANQIISLAGDQEDVLLDLVDLITPQTPPQVTSGIIRSFAGATAEDVGSLVLELWDAATPTVREDIVTVLMARPETTVNMLDAMESGQLSANDLTLDQRQTLASYPRRSIRQRAAELLNSAGNAVDENRQAVIEQYVAATHSIGNAATGKQLFVKNCASCHKHSGEGQEIGPDLTGMAVHPKEELLIHILDPSRSVESNFRRYTVLTGSGQILAGMLAAESLSAVEIIDAEGKKQSISREDIDQIAASNKSMMPEGFEQQMSIEQMTDLLEFLTQKGKFVPLPMKDVATAVSTKGLFSDSDNGPDRMVFSDWSPKEFRGVPFQLVDPLDGKRANIVLLHGPRSEPSRRMPREVSLPCNMIIKSIHLLSGASGWGFPFEQEKTTTMIVRINYEDGEVEEHPLLNGEHFADYIRRVDVPGSEFAFSLRGQQIRYLSVQPKRQQPILSIDLVKGDDSTAPIVMALTAERYE